MSTVIDNATAAAATQNTHGTEKKTKESSSAAETFSKRLAQFRVQGLVEIDGGDGDDRIDVMGGTVFGGTGNDTITNKVSLVYLTLIQPF